MIVDFLFKEKIFLRGLLIMVILFSDHISSGEIRFVQDNLVSYITNEISIPDDVSGTLDQYDPPLDEKVNPLPIFRNVIQMLKIGYISSADNLLSKNYIPYDIIIFEDVSDKHQYLILKEKLVVENDIQKITKGWGTYIIDQNNFDTNLMIEIPHPLFDGNTWEEGIRVFKGIGARAFLLAGTHRYLFEDPQTKDLFPSDVANYGGIEGNSATVFQVIHEELTDPFTHVIQLHGAKERDNTADFIISSGGRYIDKISWGISQITLKLRDIIESETDFSAEVFGTEGHTTLGAYENRQSHFSNKYYGYGRFIHLEQESKIRYRNPNDDNGDGKPDDPALPLENVDKVVDILKSIDWDAESKTFITDNFSDMQKDGWLDIKENLAPLSPKSEWSCKILDGKKWLYQKNSVFSYSDNDFEMPGTYVYNQGKSWTDYSFSCELYSVGSGWIGLIYGYFDDNNYFRFSINQNEDKWLLVEKKEGIFKKILEGIKDFNSANIQKVDISIHGYSSEIFVNQDKIINFDSDKKISGGIAAYNYSNSDNYYTSFDVKGAIELTYPINISLDSYFYDADDRVQIRLDIPECREDREFDIFLALCYPPKIWFFPDWILEMKLIPVKIPSNMFLYRTKILEFIIPVPKTSFPPVYNPGQYLVGTGIQGYPGKQDLFLSISGFVFE
jgi:hypothetical protein